MINVLPKNPSRILNCLLFLALLSGCVNNPLMEESKVKEEFKANELTVGTNLLLKSTVLNEDRPIIISLPKGYNESAANYPVLYLTDGLQNIWHVMGSVELLTRSGYIPPIIIVGIESTNRGLDFSPTVDGDSLNSGGGPNYLKFIETELIPYVDENYRTHPFRVLEGHSLGGLFAAFVLMERSDLFNAHIIMSPSFWWNNEEITTKAQSFFKTHQDLETTLFFGIGTYESGTERGMRKELTNFIDIISANKPAKLRYEHREMEKEGHMSSPLLSNYYGLKFIFSDMEVPDSLINNYSDEKFLKHEKMIMSKYGKEAKQSAEAYVQIASYLMNDNNLSSAITVIKRSVEAYSFDVGLLNFLASIYEKNKDKENARSTYVEAIRISEKYNYGREEEFRDNIKRLEAK